MNLRINSRAPTSAHPLDAYWTPPEAVRALTAIERLSKFIADPCCGTGAILDVLEAGGHIVFGSDICDYGWPRTVIHDYLSGAPVTIQGVGIVTNPPFRLAEKFIRKTINDGTPFHAWLLRTNFLEALGRMKLWRDHPPSRIWISSRRLPMMHRQGWEGPKASSNQAHAWFVWDQESNDRCKVGWFDWREYSK